MKKAYFLYRLIFMRLPLFFSGLHAAKQDYSIVFQLFVVWSTTFLRFSRSKVKPINQNHVPLQDGMLYLVPNTSSLDEAIVASSVPNIVTFILDKPKRFWLVSKQWMKLTTTMSLDKPIPNDLFAHFSNLVYLYDPALSINTQLIQKVMDAKVPIVCVKIENAKACIDVPSKKPTTVLVNFSIPIVAEEIAGLRVDEVIKKCLLELNGELS